MTIALTLPEIRELAPAAFADAPHPDVSARYQFIPTLPILNRFIEAGWPVVSAHQRSDDRFASHRLTFGVAQGERNYMGHFRPTAHLINSHDHSRRLTFSLGLEVCVCDNQLHMPIADISSAIERIHLGNGRFDLNEVFNLITSGHESLVGVVTAMRSHHIDDATRLTFARRALMHADGHGDILFAPVAQAEPLLVPLRESDSEPTVWNTLNVVQENLIEKGRKGRGIHEILRNHTLNTALWTEATALLN